MGGHTLNFDEQWVLLFKRVGDKVHLIRRNVRFKAKPGSPIAKAVETTYTDSVLLALRIHAINPHPQSVAHQPQRHLHDRLRPAAPRLLRRQPQHLAQGQGVPENIELQVAATYGGGCAAGDDSVIDDRGNTVVIHYGLCELPDGGYQPRLADDRVGHFLSVVKDFTNDSRDTPFVRYVNRWRLERADGSTWKEGGKLSPPKKKIVFWIEKSVPDEYRAAVREGILEWNKAFEKVGFRDAIEVRQQENEDFDPEDINYNTFRWITTDRGFAMGPSRANPLTGEILDADIIFDASMVRYYKQEAADLSAATARPIEPSARSRRPAAAGACRPPTLPRRRPAAGTTAAEGRSSTPLGARTAGRSGSGVCQCGRRMKRRTGPGRRWPWLPRDTDCKPGDEVCRTS